jgi:hypothetical protein
MHQTTPYHQCSEKNDLFFRATPVFRPTALTADCHCGHPIVNKGSNCKGCQCLQNCCICYFLPFHDNCQELTYEFLNGKRTYNKAQCLQGGMRTPDANRSPAPSPPSPVRNTLHTLAQCTITPPPVTCPHHVDTPCLYVCTAAQMRNVANAATYPTITKRTTQTAQFVDTPCPSALPARTCSNAMPVSSDSL